MCDFCKFFGNQIVSKVLKCYICISAAWIQWRCWFTTHIFALRCLFLSHRLISSITLSVYSEAYMFIITICKHGNENTILAVNVDCWSQPDESCKDTYISIRWIINYVHCWFLFKVKPIFLYIFFVCLYLTRHTFTSCWQCLSWKCSFYK